MAGDCGDLSLIPAIAWRGCVKQIGKQLSETQWLIQASACRHSVTDTKSLVCARPYAREINLESFFLANRLNFFTEP